MVNLAAWCCVLAAGLAGGAAVAQQDPAPVQAGRGAFAVHFGRAVDVYGWRSNAGSRAIELHRRDALVGPAALDAKGAGFASLAANPDSGRKRVLIEAEIGSAEFAAVLQRLEGTALELADEAPRDAALLVTWPAGAAAASAMPGEGDRAELVDLARGAAIPVVATEGAGGLLLDPMVVGTAALQRALSIAAGMPESRMQLRIRRGGVETTRLFRAQGLLPDAEPPQLVGEMTVCLEKVGRLDGRTRVLTLFLGGIRQRLEPGDVLRLHDPSTNQPVAAFEVLSDSPPASAGDPRRAHVRVLVERAASGEDVLERLDPSKLPGFPALGGAAREAFLLARAARVTLVVPFEPEEGDDAANFVRVADRALVDTVGNREGVSPHAGFQVRFTAPVDPATLQGLRVLDAGASHQVPMRVVALDESGRAFQLQAPLGLPMNPAVREAIRADRAQPAEQRKASFVFHVQGGHGGVKSRQGVPMSTDLTFSFVLDPEAADNFVGWRVFAPAK